MVCHKIWKRGEGFCQDIKTISYTTNKVTYPIKYDPPCSPVNRHKKKLKTNDIVKYNLTIKYKTCYKVYTIDIRVNYDENRV